MNKKMIKIRVKASETVPLDQIQPFQGEIKSLSKEAYETLRQSLLGEGLGLALHVWKRDGQTFAIDGHQRIWALKKLRDEEGFEVPEIPVAVIDADSFEEAKKRVLLALSVSGKIKEREFADYMRENNISAEYLLANMNPPGIEIQSFAEHYLNIVTPEPPPPLKISPDVPADKMASSSLQVKQVQLFFNSTDMDAFNKLVNALAEIYEIDNISDTVLRAVSEAHKLND